jgi:hypothetical protein
MFFNQHLNDRIYFHSGNSINKSLHQYIDPSLLPNEYGGQLGSIEGDINKTFIQSTRERNDYMVQFDQYGVDLKQVAELLKTVKKEKK